MKKPILYIFILTVLNAQATLVTEDFNDIGGGATSGDILRDVSTGGQGFVGAWGSGTGGPSSLWVLWHNTDLSYSGGGYNIAQTGDGHASAGYQDFRGSTRELTNTLSGTVWFSFITLYSSGNQASYLQFNNEGPNDYALSANYVGFKNGQACINGQLSAGYYSDGIAHLTVGKINFDDNGSNERIQIWVNPSDLNNLGAAEVDVNNTDLGTDLSLIGFGFDNSTTAYLGRIDAIRLSDSASAFYDVTGVPEPTAFSLIALCSITLLITKRLVFA